MKAIGYTILKDGSEILEYDMVSKYPDKLTMNSQYGKVKLMAKDNGQSKKDLEPVLAANAKVQAAQVALDDARAALNAAGERWLKTHGKAITRQTGTKESRREVKALQAPPQFVDGLLIEITQRYAKGSETPSIVVKTREVQ